MVRGPMVSLSTLLSLAASTNTLSVYVAYADKFALGTKL